MKNFKTNIRALKLLYSTNKALMIYSIIERILSSFLPFVEIYFTARILDMLVSNKSKDEVFKIVFISLIVILISEVIKAYLRKLKEANESILVFSVDSIFTKKFRELDLESLEDPEVIGLYNKISENQRNLGLGIYKFYNNFFSFINAIVSIVSSLTLTYSLFILKTTKNEFLFLNNPLFILLILVLIILNITLSSLFKNKSEQALTKKLSNVNEGNRLWGEIVDNVTKFENALDARIYHFDKFVNDKFCDPYDTFGVKGPLRKVLKVTMGTYDMLSQSISYLFNAIVYLFVGFKAIGGAFSVGYLTQYVASLNKFSQALVSIFVTLGSLKNNTVFLDDVFKFLDYTSKTKHGKDIIDQSDLEIEFKNVSFKYSGSNSYALKDINLKIKKGDSVAIVGENGSGKTTFIKLLTGLYLPSSGEVLLNGKNINEYDYDNYLKQLSVVFQDYNLLHLTINEAVASSNNYDEEKVIDSMKKAKLESLLTRVKNNTKTYVTKEYEDSGITFSGGESQKLAIARSVYKNSELVILDEPTASLDPISESEIYENFNDITKNKTTIYISHRLSSCKFCDYIVVFDKGSIIQVGSHKELASKDGKYKTLWDSQAQFYK